MPHLVRFPVKKPKVDLSLNDREQHDGERFKNGGMLFMDRLKWKDRSKMAADANDKVDLLLGESAIDVWQSR